MKEDFRHSDKPGKGDIHRKGNLELHSQAAMEEVVSSNSRSGQNHTGWLVVP